MRTFDVWIGRLGAAAGVVYVALSGAWPLADDGVDARGDAPRAR